MIRIRTRLVPLAALISIVVPVTAFGQDTVTILHVNDVHSRIEPINRFNATCSAEDDAAGECFGGAARLVTAIREAKDAAEHPVLVLDGGDQFQGSLFYTNYKGEAAAELVNAIAFDAMAVGNHEFDDGNEVLKRFADAIDVPLLMANADIESGSTLDGATLASVVIERGGHSYGIIGLTPEDNGEVASPGPGIAFTDPVEAVRAEVASLSDQGVERIIVLSHSGILVDQRVASEVAGIDLIVGGHSHTLLSNTIEGALGPYPVMAQSPDGATPIVQAGAYSRYLGKIDLTFDEDGHVTAAVGDTSEIGADVAKDPDMDAKVRELAAPLEAIRNEVIGETTATIDGDRSNCRARECQMGNLVADAMLDRVSGQGVQIAIQNGGGLRASIEAGEVTMGDVLTVLPFQNTLATFELPGAGVRAALENGVSQVEEGAGRFPQVAGLRYTADLTRPVGERIASVEVATSDGFAPLDDAATYLLVSNNYMRQGGDGYDIFETDGENAYDYGPGLEEVLAAYLEKTGPYTPFLDGRITVD